MTGPASEPAPQGGPLPGPDGLPRCPWGLSAEEYVAYHDNEWGRPVRGDDALFERLCLEAFQSGLRQRGPQRVEDLGPYGVAARHPAGRRRAGPVV
ncbi:DNA-3-methyladenine glycosylase I, partial [Streptomyces sp. NPDC048845]|uniref:DNA-3-methyladenine glycosylase I n=1 Tax=Streptomyces sp. NPDC048845 TaxID=3155390 RepID=UPI003425C167